LKIDFRKISNQAKNFELSKDLIKFRGSFSKIKNNLVEINGEIKGNISLVCSRCGCEFDEDLKQELELLVSDGIINHHELKSIDVIEMKDFLDFDFILNSELESIKSDLCFCANCKDLEEIEIKI